MKFITIFKCRNRTKKYDEINQNWLKTTGYFTHQMKFGSTNISSSRQFCGVALTFFSHVEHLIPFSCAFLSKSSDGTIWIRYYPTSIRNIWYSIKAFNSDHWKNRILHCATRRLKILLPIVSQISSLWGPIVRRVIASHLRNRYTISNK